MESIFQTGWPWLICATVCLTIYSNMIQFIHGRHINEQVASNPQRRFVYSHLSVNNRVQFSEQQTACMTTCIEAHKNVTIKCCEHEDCTTLPVTDLMQYIGNCAVDGLWLKWGEWSHCSSTCAGTRYRNRQCYYPAHLPQGQFCNGHGFDSEHCGPQSC